IAARKGPPTIVDRDESVREDTTPATLAALKPAFTPTGTVTAGNAPGLNDGASAVVVMSEADAQARGLTPLARIVGQATSGLEPKWVMMTPVEAVRLLLAKTGWSIGDVDLFEINEAFSVQAIAVTRELGLDPAKVNVNGGAVALGHPIGASGARVLTTLLYAMQRRQVKRGVAALCLGGGNGVALAVER
ncbi:MAG: acetyl-CoA C-acyltransferase, partial [Vicinamibacteraceae bacterium]